MSFGGWGSWLFRRGIFFYFVFWIVYKAETCGALVATLANHDWLICLNCSELL